MNRTRSVESAEDSPVEMTVETVSPTASDVGSMSDSPAKAAPQKKKKRGLSFKKIRNNAQRLIPGRKKENSKEKVEGGGGEEVPEGTPPLESPPPTPVLKEMKSTESLPAIKEEAKEVLQTTKSIDEIPKVKKTRKPSRAASFVKKLAGRKAKVAPNPPKGEDEASASTTETPLSIKRRTPEGANLSVSETSLYEGDKPIDSFKIEQLESEPKVVRTISPKKTEMKITLINNASTAEGTSSSSAATARASGSGGGVQLPTASASLGSSSLSSSSTTTSSTSSPTSGADKAKPGSVASVGEPKSDALLRSSAAPSTIDSKPIKSAITTAIDQELTISALLAGDYNRFSIDKVDEETPASPREKFFQPLINAVSTDQDQDNAAETLEVNDNVAVVTPPTTPTSEDPAPSNAGKLKNIFMKKDAQKKAKSAAAKAAAAAAAAAATASEGSSSSTTANDPKPATVRTQEAAKPYQLAGNNIKNPNLPGFKSLEPPGTETIVFNIGSTVRPDRTGSAKKPVTTTTANLLPPSLEGGAALSGNFNQSKSLEEYGSIEGGGPDSSPLSSESSRRRIAYVAQPTDFTPEEEELVSGRPSLLSSSAGGGAGSSSLEESADFLETSGSKMSPHGDLLLEKGGEQLSNMSAAPTEKREHLYKILVIGELGTGKTSFIKRYVHQFFSQNYRATIGVDFALKVLNWDQNTIIRLQLWDIAGQERFGNMTRVYYKEAVGAFIVFDVTRSATFDAVIKWKQDLDSKVQLPDGKPIPCILLANKSDQQKQGIVTTPAKLDEYVKEHGFAGWFETSAKENVNIEEAAKSLVNKILTNDKQINAGELMDTDRFALAGGKTDPTQKKSCAC
ncbi:mucin-5AC isoform X1 [Culex pipiens pallens]|uniref:mucin-5AC isoform X1 n=1 Tax=Culex pipiens pallens TaxID=42434 RepID=UPI0019542A1F|nr:mucin-5AC isoform X1 [Culex pipiens pallens]